MTAAVRSKAAPRTGVDWFLTFMRVGLSFFFISGVIMFVLQQIDPQNPIAQVFNPDATGLTADQFEGLIISGLSQGAMYGLIALGYSMVYGVLGFINFAHGEVFMGRAMTGFFMASWFQETGLWVDNFALALILVVVAGVVLSLIHI